MQLPFSRAEFLDVFADVNRAIWPGQIALAVIGIAGIALLFWRPRWADRGIAGVLAAIWLLTGIGYHWLYFSAINPLAWLFGALFVAGGALFGVEGTMRGRIRFELGRNRISMLALLLVLYALVVYPLIGLLLTDPWPETPLFGIAPCPTTIYTLGLLLVARHPRRWLLAAAPVLWGVIGGSAAFLLGMPQDYGLVAALAAWLLVANSAATPLEGRNEVATRT